MNWVKFFHMGGYAVFVWPSYALSAVVLALNVILPLWERKRLLRGHNSRTHNSGKESS
jgi:heme exporter protein D